MPKVYAKRFPQERHCRTCQQAYQANADNHFYCQLDCRPSALGIRPSWTHALPRGTVGAIAELCISTDLMKRGYDVFRALSPHASCDLIALKGEQTYYIEARTGFYDGLRLQFPSKHHANVNCMAIWDKFTHLVYYVRPETYESIVL